MKVSFSIRHKFLVVTTALLLMCVVVYLLLATHVFKGDKTELVFDYKKSLVTNIGLEVENIIQKSDHSMKLIHLMLEQDQQVSSKIIDKLFEDSKSFIYMAYSKDYKNISKTLNVDKKYFETYLVNPEKFTKNIQIPIEQIQKHGKAIWGHEFTKDLKVLGYAKSFYIKSQNKQIVLVSFLNVDQLYELITQPEHIGVHVVSQTGQMILEGKKDNFQASEELARRFKQTSVKASVFKKAGSIIAFYKVPNSNLSVVSYISEKNAFGVLQRLMYRTLIFSLIVFTLAFIVAILFSGSLTKPITTLIEGMKKVAGGDLKTQIPIQSKDEIAILAHNFNKMIHELKVSKEALEEINRDLEEKVRERTKRLEEQNQAVKKAQEALLRTSRLAAVGEVAGQTAHEILNPLTVIMAKVTKIQKQLKVAREQEVGVLKEILNSWEEDYKKGGFEQLLAAWKGQSAVNESQNLWEEDVFNIQSVSQHMAQELEGLGKELKLIQNEGSRISRIMQSMKSLSVVRSNTSQFCLQELIAEAVKIMADLASQMHSEIIFERDNENVMVEVDEDEFIQVLVNLIRNSIQSIKVKRENIEGYEGEVRITVHQDAAAVYVDVSDNGVGISKKDQEKIFDSQFTTKPKKEGTGLGLGISRRFIRAVEGDLKLKHSEVGKGSVFELSLPIEKQSKKRSA